MEPVNAGAVDNSRELSPPHTQCATHRRKAQYHLQIIINRPHLKNMELSMFSVHLELSSNSIDEESPAVFPGVLKASVPDLNPHPRNNVLHIVSGK